MKKCFNYISEISSCHEKGMNVGVFCDMIRL